jgi:hypothetical protein
MFNSDTFANRPAFGIVGRIFISTDTKEFFRDTGTSWELIGGPGSGTITGSGTIGTLPIWTTTSALGDSIVTQSGSTIEIKATAANDSVLNIDTTTGDYSRIEFQNAGNLRSRIYFAQSLNQLSIGTYNTGGSVEIEVDNNVSALVIDSLKNSTFQGYISAVPTLTAASNASSVAIIGVNTLSYAASFSANNIGAIYGAITGFNLQTFAGNATFANSNVASGGSSVNSIDFSSVASTITMTQSSGIRVMSGQQNLFQYQGTNSGTITHAAISQNTGFYRPSAATGILTITNAYSHLINALDDYGAGFTFTNRWGIYQAGASDINYFAANVLLGSTTNNGNKLQTTGNANITGNLGVGIVTATTKLEVSSSDLNNIFVRNPDTTGATTGSGIGFKAYDGISVTQNAGIILTSNTWSFGTYSANQLSIGSDGTGGIALRTANSAPISFFTGGTTAGLSSQIATFTSGGRLGIGASTPSARIEISGIISDAAIDWTNTTAVTGRKFRWVSLDTGGFAIEDITAVAQRLLISSAGNVLINTPSDPGQKLYLNGSLRIDGQQSATSGGNSGQHLIINLDGTTYKIKLENP